MIVRGPYSVCSDRERLLCTRWSGLVRSDAVSAGGRDCRIHCLILCCSALVVAPLVRAPSPERDLRLRFSTDHVAGRDFPITD